MFFWPYMGDVANTSSHCIIKQMVKNVKSVFFRRWLLCC